MRIGGEKVHHDAVVEVRYPYTDEVIGTVPAGHRRTCRARLRDRGELHAHPDPLRTQQILFRAAELIRERREEIAHG
jgi:acyl-CoA reductase-like NAD-dependent aldehyde dehydrogenase